MRTPTTPTTNNIINNNNNSFSVLTYNVLAKSLATNMIPWVMKISNPSIIDRIVKLEQQQQQSNTNTNNEQQPIYNTLDNWINTKIKPEYMKHFHKNFDSGNYVQMRQLWSSTKLHHQNDIPIDLCQNVKFVSEDCISYEKKIKTKNNNDNDNDTTTVVTEVVEAKTLRGISKLHLSSTTSTQDPNLFDDFINDVMSRELTVFDWINSDSNGGGRGSRLFQTIFNTSPKNDSNKPDIIALQEYDFHNEYININSIDDDDNDDDGNRNGDDDVTKKPTTQQTTTSLITFADAMLSKNYNGVFLKDPLLDRDPPSGIGLFWNTNVFESINNSGSESSNNNESSCQGEDRQGGPKMEIIDCNASGFNGSVSNHDLLEQWHPITNKKQQSKKDEQQQQQQRQATTTSSLVVEKELLPAKDRRNVGICTLKHKGSKKLIKIVVTHLMTTSRDSIKTNLYPGEVRAGEIEKMKQLVCCCSSSSDDGSNDTASSEEEAAAAVIVLGDMNTNALDNEDANIVFGGTVPSSSIKTSTSSSSSSTLQFDTGFDTTTSTFTWNDHILKDAFEKQHQWGNHHRPDGDGDGDGEGNNNNYCTSRNANRMEWIDYVFYDTTKLNLLETSECQIHQPIPDEIHPSDHIPLYAKFEFM